MTEEDLFEVLKIESQGHTRPWPEAIFREELQREWASLIVLRAGDNAPVVAYANYWTVVDEVQILNIVTAAEHRRKGYGQALLRHILQQGRDTLCKTVSLEVRKGNAAAIALYERHGFQCVGIRPQYYADNKEDALVMTVALGDSPTPS